MEKIKIFWSKYSRTILVAIIVIMVIFLVWSKIAHSYKNPIIVTPVNNIQTTTKSRFNDTLTYIKQEALLAQTQAQVKELESSLQLALSRKININKTTASIEYKDSIVYISLPGHPTDEDSNGKAMSKEFPLHFTHNNGSLSQIYTVYSPDSSSIDFLSVTNKGHLLIGETGKWFQKKKLVVGLLNENPYYIVDSVKSVVYVPKPHLELSVGPIMLFNAKSTSLGAGVTIKKGIFSFTAGYKLF